ncbi:MAG TPA: zf-HC2 domain-containing protein [Pyrinomonadaceae bacterium]
MTPNDTQMDVLMRRYAKGAKAAGVSTEHLDADELNAFAEGALPAATRSRYVSHLADCDDCRTVVSQLAMSAGAGTMAQVPASESPEKRSWWQSLGALLSTPALRYAASALILVAVVGIAFVVWRQSVQQRNSSLVARNEPRADQAAAVSSPQVPLTAKDEGLSQSTERNAQTNVQPTPGATKAGESPSLDAPAPKKETDAAPAESTIIASDRAMKASPREESTPSYAPPPPAENSRVDTRQREQAQPQVQQQQTNVAGNVQHGGPRRNESNEKYKGLDDRGRAVELAKSRDEDRARSANQPATTENKEQDAVQARSGSVSGAALPPSPRKITRDEATKDDKTSRAQSDDITSVGGRRFRRVGNAWVDLKFKSSMPVTTVARGSGDFAALDSKVRSIAQQLGGEVIVVWKGKAYRIR